MILYFAHPVLLSRLKFIAHRLYYICIDCDYKYKLFYILLCGSERKTVNVHNINLL